MRKTVKSSWDDSNLIRQAGTLWQEATLSPFLDALAEGSLPENIFYRWLSQDFLFAKGLTTFQGILLSKAPRDCHKPLISGLSALDRKMDWFETHSRDRKIKLDELPPSDLP